MKNLFPRSLCLFLFSAMCVTAFFGAAQAQNRDEAQDGLRVKIECEEPSGIFLDSETTMVRRAILFSIHAFNQTSQPREVVLNWRVRDASGKVVQAGDAKYPVPAGGFITRRELLSTPKLGAFVLQADAFSRADGPDYKAEQSFPFAIIATPKKDARPFLLLDAPLELDEKQLAALSRLGARVLRTEVAPSADEDDGVSFWRSLNAALEARIALGIATVGVLRAPRGEGAGRERNDEEWLQWALRVMQQTPLIATWEITGQASPDTISELARAAQNMSPPRGVFATPRAAAGDWKRLQPVAGLLYPLSAEDAEVHPAALRRAFLGAQSRSQESGLPSFHVRNVGALNTTGKSSALESAQLMTTQTVAALDAGAQGASTRLFADDRLGLESLARGAAFANLSAQIGDADFYEDLFPTSPVITGAVFGRENGGGSVAVLWTAPGQDGKESKGRLEAWMPDAVALDLFGNLLAGAERKNISLPLSAQPIFISSSVYPEELARRLREGFVSDIAPLAAQVLPLEAPLVHAGEMKPKDNKFAPSNKLAIRVRLQNIGVGDLSGTLKISPPPSWKLDADKQQFDLKPGESRIYDFGVSQVKPNDQYPVKVDASAVQKNGGKTKKDNWSWTQNAMMATATNITRDESVVVDGNLSDWRDAMWMKVENKKSSAKLAVRWDATHLYIAALVREARLVPRNPDGEYSFWRGNDAIQIAFGLRDAAWMQPGSGPFRDTDFGFLLSPFHARPDGTIDARVLRLWNPQAPFAKLPDRTRWAGAAPGAHLEIRRNERGGETLYEAAIPLSEIPELNPATRVASAQSFGNPVRFAWIVHENDGEKLQWARENHVFDWWNNTGSFLPSSDFSVAAQTFLGFAQIGAIGAGTPGTAATGVGSTPTVNIAPPPIPNPPIAPAPVLPPPPALPAEGSVPPYLPNVEAPPPPESTPTPPTAPPPPRTTPAPSQTPAPPPALPRPVPVEPISPDMLPPAPSPR
jgi:hypothetical protein